MANKFNIYFENFPDKDFTCLLDKKQSGWQNSPNTIFDGTSGTGGKIRVKCNSSTSIGVFAIDLYVGDTLVRSLKMSGGNLFWVTYASYPAGTGFAGVSLNNVLIDINDETVIYGGGNPYWVSQKQSESSYSSVNGTASVKAKIYYKDTAAGTADVAQGSKTDADIITETFTLGYVMVLEPKLNSISIATMPSQTSFYKNSSFNYTGLAINATYKYQVAETIAYTQNNVQGYGVLAPSLSAGTSAQVGIKYETGGVVKWVYYTISIISAKSHQEKVSSKTAYKIGEAFETIGKSHVIYEDNTSSDDNITVSGYNANLTGTQTITYSLRTSKTKEDYSWTQTITVYDVTQISLTTTSVKKNFNYNETFEYTNLIVTRTYGLAGTDIASTGYTVTPPEWKVGSNLSVVVSYKGLSASYKININGLSAMNVDLTSCSLYDSSTGKLRIKKNGTLITTGKTVSVQRYTNGVLGSWETYLGAVNVSTVDVSTTGEKNIVFSIQENGVSLSFTSIVIVYDYSSLVLTNKPELFFIKTGVYPTFAKGNLIVTANTTDGRTVEINDYTVSPAFGTTLTQDTTVTISALGATSSFLAKVEENHPADDATITVSGYLFTDTYSVGETVDLNGISVFVSKMAGGETNFNVGNDYTAKIVGLNRLNFQSGDTLGSYDLEISVDGVDLPVTLNDAVKLNGLLLSDIEIDDITTPIKCGTTLTASMFSGTIGYKYGASRYTIKAEDITSISPSSFSNTYGSKTISLTIKGQVVTTTITVAKMKEITFALNGYDTFVKHNSFDTSNVSLVKKYTIDGSTEYSAFRYTFTKDEKDELIVPEVGTLEDLLPNESSADVDLSGSVTEGGVTCSFSDTIVVKALASVELLDPDGNDITKVAYNFGQQHNLTGYYLRITLNNGDTFTVQITADTEYAKKNDFINSSVAISTSISYTYAGDTKSALYTIHCHYLSDISVDFSSITGSTHYEYDTIDLSGITATRTISSTDEDDTSYPQTESITVGFTFNGQDIDSDSFSLPTQGTYPLVAKYSLNGQSISKTQNITVNTVVLSSISLDTTASFKSLDDYVEEQNLNLTGLNVTLHYNKTSSDRTISISDNDWINVSLIDENGNTFAKNKELVTATDDGLKLYVKYQDKTAELGTLTVTAKELSSIDIVSSPLTQFTYGDAFNINNAVVRANFNSGKTSLIQLSQLTVSGVALGHVFGESDGVFDDEHRSFTFSITLSFTYDGTTKTTTYSITMIPPTLVMLKTNVDSGDVVLQYQDRHVFSPDNLVITAVYANGYTKVLSSYTDNSATVLNLDAESKIDVDGDYGFKTITVSGTDPYTSSVTKTVNYSIEVSSSQNVVSALLAFDTSIDYKNYFVGDTFDAKGVYFKVTDIDGNIWNATNFETSIAKGSVLRSGQRITIICTYTNGEFTASDSYTILVNVPHKDNYVDDNNYKIAVGYANGIKFTQITHDEAVIALGKVYEDGVLVSECYPIFHEDLVGVDTNPLHTDTLGFNVYTGANADSDCIGYLDMGISGIKSAHLVFFDDVKNPVDGNGNIEITFPHYSEGAADKINKCKFGIIYNNRLFISGNSEMNNVDWHSGNDFTYFSDLDYCKYGSDLTSVVGFTIYRDGDLIVAKESSRNEATLYRRSHKYVQAVDFAGNEVEGQIESSFPMFDINVNGGDGGLNSRTVLDFMGDSLILTKVGLKVISSKNDVYNSLKYAIDVSSNINTKITKEELENSHMFTYKGRLFLKTNRGVYVGYYDLRNEESNEYEWYFLNNINADLFFEINDELYFANDEGKIYRFPQEILEFTDKSRTFIGIGGASLFIGDDTIVASAQYKDDIQEGREFHLITTYSVSGVDVRSQVHANLGTFVEFNTRQNAISQGLPFDQTLYAGIINGNEIELKPYNSEGEIDVERLNDLSDVFFDGRIIYLDEFVGGSTDLKEDTPYKLVKSNDDPFDYKFKLVDENGEDSDLSSIEYFRLSFIVNDLEKTHITQVEDYGTSGAKQFKLIGDHDKILDLIHYAERDDRYSGVITKEDNVEAFYVTAPYSMGTIAYTKTIWQWTIANDTELASYMDVGYLTSRLQGDYEFVIKSASGSNQVNFNGFSFDKVQFTSDKLPHIYNKFRTLPNVGFIRFLFRNNENTNLVLTTLTVTYTISSSTKGVK